MVMMLYLSLTWFLETFRPQGPKIGYKRASRSLETSKTTCRHPRTNKIYMCIGTELRGIFELRDLVFLCLHPYRQSTLKHNGDDNLKPCFYGSYRVTRCVGEVAYESDLPLRSNVHSVFHVSCLKKALEQQVTAATELPPLDDGKHLLVPKVIF